MQFIDPRKTPFVKPQYRGELPHLYKPGAIYFVTYRLADAGTRVVRAITPPEVQMDDVDPEKLLGRYDPPLTSGSRALGRPAVADLVQETLLEGHGAKYELASWCVMPNHVHVVYAPLLDSRPALILQSWKGGTARKINLLLGRHGSFWERESFDHVVRSVKNLKRFIRYVEENPVEAGLCAEPTDWPYSSAGVGFECVIEA